MSDMDVLAYEHFYYFCFVLPPAGLFVHLKKYTHPERLVASCWLSFKRKTHANRLIGRFDSRPLKTYHPADGEQSNHRLLLKSSGVTIGSWQSHHLDMPSVPLAKMDGTHK